MDHDEILEEISEAITICDKHREYGTGDRLFNTMIALKEEWNYKEEE